MAVAACAKWLPTGYQHDKSAATALLSEPAEPAGKSLAALISTNSSAPAVLLWPMDEVIVSGVSPLQCSGCTVAQEVWCARNLVSGQ